MKFPSLKEVQRRKQELQNQPLKKYQQFFEGLGNYFLLTRPTHLDNGYILEVESLLNDLYILAVTKGWSSNLENTINKALGKAAFLSESVQKLHAKQARSEKFFITAKELGKLLLFIAKFCK